MQPNYTALPREKAHRGTAVGRIGPYQAMGSVVKANTDAASDVGRELRAHNSAPITT